MVGLVVFAELLLVEDVGGLDLAVGFVVEFGAFGGGALAMKGNAS